jgi:tRNA threonylcarbamoyladenosine biosynthesis protein TsaB
MRVLAIDTALGACSAAVLDTEQGGIVASASQPMMRGHAEALIPLLGRVTAEAHMAFRDFDRIVVTTGPGSFTGLRVGIAAARGIALSIGKPAVGLSTLSAYAAPHLAGDENTPVVVAIDARHQHVYLQVFGAGGRTSIAPRLAPLAEAIRAAAQAPARIVGSAAQAVADGVAEFPARTPPQPIVVDTHRAPDIAWVARIGAAVSEAQAPPKPQYLRAPDAQPQYAASLPRR